MGKGALTPVANLKGQFKKTIKTGDLLFSEIRPANRRFAKVTATECQDFVVSTKLMVLRKFNDQVDSDYFYYCLTNQPFLDTLQRRAENRIGSFPQITFDLLSGYAFPIPPLEEQKRISKVIASIDRKIELNKQINDNLEAMARQLYDYWFVQFDFPDENGRPYKSSGGKMVWNEMLKRDIPEAWETSTIKDIAKTYSGGTPKSTNSEFYENGNIPWINSGELNEPIITSSPNYITQLGLDNSSAKKYPKGTILIALYGATAGKVSYLSFEACSNQAVCGVMTNNKALSDYVRYYLSSLYEHFVTLSTGSARSNISQETVKDTMIILPSNKILAMFNKVSNNIMKVLISNKIQIDSLTKQRDELLPLLMNGQATVNYHLSDD